MTPAGISTSRLVVDHRFGARLVRALDHGPMSVEAGTSVALMGPSGCGKSTLLSVIAGLALPTAGSVHIGDVEVSALDDAARTRLRRRHMGVVFQSDNLLPHLSVEENIALPLALAGRSTGPVAGLLDRLGLSSLAKRLPDELSGGQRQRAAVARAVACEPELVLADEPTGALDSESARAVMQLLKEARDHIGATLVIVTHDHAVADCADRVELIRRAEVPA